MIKGQSYNVYMFKESNCSFFFLFFVIKLLFYSFVSLCIKKLNNLKVHLIYLETVADHFNYT